MARLILDTNIIKWFSSPYTNRKTIKSSEILQSICDGKHEGIIIPPVILEIYYKLSESDSEDYAKTFIETLLSMPNLYVIVLTKDIGMFAGELYLKYNVIPRQSDPTLRDTPGAVDCLIAATNKFVENSLICTDDQDIHNMNEINSDFFRISI